MLVKEHNFKGNIFSFIIIPFIVTLCLAAHYQMASPIMLGLVVLLLIISIATIYYLKYTMHQLINNIVASKLELDEAKSLTENSLLEKTEFFNNVCHEIRTPVHGFTIISEGLVENWYLVDELQKYKWAKKVSENAQKLESLINNLLDISKFSAGKMLMNFNLINLNQSVEKIIEECHSLYLMKKELSINLVAHNQVSVVADDEKINQVLRNLFFNAIKFTPSGGSIEASIELINNEVHFSIADSGIGVLTNELLEIFTPFMQSARTKTIIGGTGLGLSIAKKVIEAHSGEIWAENNKIQGATFHFTIPLTQTK